MRNYLNKMKKYIIIALVSGTVLTSCGEYNKVLKSTDYEYKYEAAKSYFGKGQNTKAATILEELITIMKGTDKAEESLYMLGMTYYNQGDFITASHYFTTYYNTYPRGVYTEQARYFQEKHCSWILRNLVWTSRALIKLFRSCRCLWNISQPVAVGRMHSK